MRYPRVGDALAKCPPWTGGDNSQTSPEIFSGPSEDSLPDMRKLNDPDGIRTRVAALKGPCPRPLDDGAAAGDRSPALGGAKQYADGERAVNDPAQDWLWAAKRFQIPTAHRRVFSLAPWSKHVLDFHLRVIFITLGSALEWRAFPRPVADVVPVPD